MTLFIDRDLGKRFGRALRMVGVNVVLLVERYPSADAESVPDETWIREAARRSEVIVTRDGRIRRQHVELRAIADAGARCFVLETGNATPFDYLRAAMIAWPRIQGIIETEEPPYMFGISRKGRVRRLYPASPAGG